MLCSHGRTISRVVFFDVDSFPFEGFTNGATIQYREIFIRLQRSGMECAIVTVAEARQSRLWSPCLGSVRVGEVSKDIPVIQYLIDGPASERIDDFVKTINRAIKEISPDLIFVNPPPARLEEVEVVLFEILASSALPVYCFFHDALFPLHVDDSEKHLRYQKVIKKFRIIAPSEFIKKRIHEQLGLDSEIMWNLFSLDVVLNRDHHGPYITFINPHPMKGLTILEALAHQMPEREFLVVGGWSYTARSEEHTSELQSH